MKKLLIVLSLLLFPTITEAEYYYKLKLSNSTCVKYCGKDFVYDAKETGYGSFVCKKYPKDCGKNCHIAEWDDSFEVDPFPNDQGAIFIECLRPLQKHKDN